MLSHIFEDDPIQYLCQEYFLKIYDYTKIVNEMFVYRSAWSLPVDSIKLAKFRFIRYRTFGLIKRKDQLIGPFAQ